MHIVIVNGTNGSGKDTFCKFAIEELHRKGANTHKFSYIDYAKGVLRSFGWDGTKDENTRNALYHLNEALSCLDDSPMVEMLNTIAKSRQHGCDIVFVDIREPRIMDRLRFFLEGKNYSFSKILVERNGTEIANNPADGSVYDTEYDYIIANYDDVNQLRETAKTFVEEII